MHRFETVTFQLMMSQLGKSLAMDFGAFAPFQMFSLFAHPDCLVYYLLS